MNTKYTKGVGPVSAAYAVGGPPITTKSRFLKTPDNFRARTDVQRQDYSSKPSKAPKKGEGKIIDVKD